MNTRLAYRLFCLCVGAALGCLGPMPQRVMGWPQESARAAGRQVDRDAGQALSQVLPPASDLEDGRMVILKDLDGKVLVNDTAPGAARVLPAAKKWLGVACEPVTDVLRAHVDLPEGTGLVVQQVVPDSPAEAAGLQQHDILMQAGGNKLTSVEDLISALNDAGEVELSLVWLRKGDRLTKSVKPAERPASVTVFAPDGEQPSALSDAGNIKAWVEQRLQQGDAPSTMQFRFLGPGMDLGNRSTGNMPANLTIRVEKQGDEPARIKVTRDQDTWEITENDVDSLPEDIRPHVARMLSGNGGLQIQMMRPGIIDDLDVQVPWPRMEQRFDEINRRMEEMFQQLERMQEMQPFPQPDAKNDDVDPNTDA